MRNFGGPTNWRHFCQVHVARGKRKQAKQQSRQRKFNRVLEGYQQEMLDHPTALETTLQNILFELKIPFRPQVIIDRFIVDILIEGHGIKKIIEADGPHHEHPLQRRKEARRDQILKKRWGYQILHLRRHEFYNLALLKQRITDFVFDTEGAPALHKPDSKTLDERFEGEHINAIPAEAKTLTSFRTR